MPGTKFQLWQSIHLKDTSLVYWLESKPNLILTSITSLQATSINYYSFDHEIVSKDNEA